MNFLSNISRRTTCAALARCMASLSKLSCSHAFLIASPISLSNVRSTLHHSLHSLRSGKTDNNLAFSLVLCIRPSTAAPNCSRRALYVLARSASLNTFFKTVLFHVSDKFRKCNATKMISGLSLSICSLFCIIIEP